ncbi:MAG TPA: ATP phosphoribosyltransferase [Dehalococcoidia bacterium]|nr:ATP phosphoribosyltransferase [Dehalococcoidia bacterium]
MIKLALPTGDLREPSARLLEQAGIANADYAAGSRLLRLPLSAGAEEATIRVFRERDIPIQIALGNYDLGICGLAQIEELRLRFPQDELVLLRPLPFGRFEARLATDAKTAARLGPLAEWPRHAGLRIASDLPTLAEAFALAAHLPAARVIPVLGSADAYPPEDADIVLIAAAPGAALEQRGLRPLLTVLAGEAWLIASRRSLAQKPLGGVLHSLLELPPAAPFGDGLQLPRLPAQREARPWTAWQRPAGVLRLAVPDGHQQRHACASLREAGLCFDGYSESEFVRRPSSGVPGLEVKVIRPQDMPQQVALGNFDLAMTGRDVLREHLLAFPDSPVAEVVDLGRSRYGIAAVVDAALPANTIEEALDAWRRAGRGSVRIASEYPNIADHYARSRHFGRYQVMPVAGASEGFVPEDAEVLIEGSETGKSIAANNLKIVEAVFESTNCLITGRRPLGAEAEALRTRLIERFRAAAAAR